jgi:raffinose synthase
VPNRGLARRADAEHDASLARARARAMRVDVRGDAVAVVDGDVDVFRELGPHVACARAGASARRGTRAREDRDGLGDCVAFHLRADRARSRHRVKLCGEMCATAFVASARCKLWWMTPTWGHGGEDVRAETQFALMELGDGAGYACALPTSGAHFRTTLEGNAKGEVWMIVESNCEEENAIEVDNVMVMACAKSPYEAIRRAMAETRTMLGTFELLEDKKLPETVDVFGWCTWDAFYTDVTPDGIEQGVQTLRDGGAPARFVIIDDGWQSVLPDKSYRKVSKKDKTVPDSNAVVVPPPTTSASPPPGVLAAMAASFYWSRLHASRFRSLTWHIFRLLMNYVFYHTVKVVVSSMSHFNHRVYAVKANHKFQKLHVIGSGMSRTLSQRVLPKFFRRKLAGASARPSQLDLLPEAESVDGLAKVVRKIKTEFGVEYVYCWHALLGYWGGIHPDEENVAKYGSVMKYPKHTPGVLTVEPSQAWDPLTVGGVGVPSPETLAHFYVVTHDYLSASDVDGVKVDAQAVIGALGYKNGGGPAFARRVHAALEESVRAHFPDNGIINCMCHSTENIYNFKSSALARASDDFYPANEASHTVHIANVVYNSIFMGEIVLPDWDMFQSQHVAGALHAATRAIGGCPVYVSDHPGKHDFEILHQLVFPSGRVLRCRQAGRPTRDCLFRDVTRDGRTALKVWNRNFVNSVIGVFNIQGASWSRATNQFASLPKPISATLAELCPRDVEGIADRSTQGASFVVRSHRNRRIEILRLKECTSIMLMHKDWEIYTIAELLEQGDIKFAAIGLTAMYNGGGSILRIDMNGRSANVTAYGLGELACYASRAPTSVHVDGRAVSPDFDPRTGALSIDLGATEGTHELQFNW